MHTAMRSGLGPDHVSSSSHSHGSFRMPTRRPKGAMGLTRATSKESSMKALKVLKVKKNQEIDFNLFPERLVYLVWISVWLNRHENMLVPEGVIGCW